MVKESVEKIRKNGFLVDLQGKNIGKMNLPVGTHISKSEMQTKKEEAHNDGSWNHCNVQREELHHTHTTYQPEKCF